MSPDFTVCFAEPVALWVDDLVADFVAAVRGIEADGRERELLQLAVDACCHDPDADTRVSA